MAEGEANVEKQSRTKPRPRRQSPNGELRCDDDADDDDAVLVVNRRQPDEP